MKNALFALALLAAGFSGVRAESPAPPPEGPRGPMGGGDMRMRMKERFLENLTPENRQRFEAAREKALQDPKIQELRNGAETANREFFEAMRRKMMEIDPGLEAIVKDARGGRKDMEPREGGRREGGRDGGFGNLDDAEKQQLMAAREKAKADPAVQAADKMKAEASTPEARKAAGDAYRKAMHTALLKADPTIGPVLEKLGPKPAAGAPVPGGDGEMMNPP